MGNLTIPAQEWLAELFECEYCADKLFDEPIEWMKRTLAALGIKTE